MAMKVNAGADMKRADYFYVDPFEIEVCEELRGRHTPPTEEQIIDMAISLNEHGQRQAVECRKIEGDRLRLNLGFTRMAAARLLREGFKYTDPQTNQKVEVKDDDFKLKVAISDANDQQAFLNNIVENAHRNNTSAMDDAHNQHRLRDKYGYDDAQITKLYGWKDVNKVPKLRRLLGLSKIFQDQIHDGTLSVQAGIDILDLPEDKRQATIDAATKEGGKVSGTTVRQIVREHHLSDDNKPNSPGGKGRNGQPEKVAPVKARVLSEVRKFLEKEVETNQDDNIKTFCKNMGLWIAGRRTDKFMHDQLDALLDAERG